MNQVFIINLVKFNSLYMTKTMENQNLENKAVWKDTYLKWICG